MAAVKKTKPLSIDELLDAQRAQLSSSEGLSESQIKYAKLQIQKLEEIKKAMLVNNIEELKNDYEIKAITRPKGDSKHVTLGDVREQLKTLDKTIKQNLVNRDGDPVDPRRAPLPKFSVIEGGKTDESADTTADSEAKTQDELDQERTDRLRKIGGVIEKKTAIQKAGARNEQLNTRNAAVYDRFVSESKDREKFLTDATDEQKQIFKQLEDTMIKLREAGSEDSDKLREEIAHLSGRIEESPDNNSKKYMKPMMENIQRTASTGNRGNEGTLGDVFSALTGKKTVLKEGFSYDSRGAGSQIRNDETSKFASAKEAGMSRLKGAGSILGNWVLEKNEKNIEGMRHEGFQKFLDNFRPSTTDTGRKSGAPETGTRLENIAKLQGQQDELMNQRDDFNAEPTVERKRPNLSVIEGGRGADRGADAHPKSGMSSKIDELSVTANVVNINGDNININGAGGGGGGGGRSSGGRSGGGSKPSSREPKAEPKQAKPKVPKEKQNEPTQPKPRVAKERQNEPTQPKPTAAPAGGGGGGITSLFSGGGGGGASAGPSGTKTLNPLDPVKPPVPGAPGGGKEEGGFGVSDAVDLASNFGGKGSIMSRAGSMISGAGEGAMAMGRTALMGAAEVAAPAAIMYGAVRGFDWGMGKLGVGKDDEGNDLKFDEKQDDANWDKMAWYEKAQSAIPRGIEKVGDWVAPNVAAQARADRMGAENAYFAEKEGRAAPEKTPGIFDRLFGGGDSKKVEGARATGGPVARGKDYLVGERGPEVFTPNESGKVVSNKQLKDLQGDDLKDFQKYSQARAQIESIESMGGGNNTFADVDPELKIKRDKMMRDNYEYGEKLKARGIDVDAHYNRPEGAAEPKMGEAGYVSLADRYNSKNVTPTPSRDHAGTLDKLSSENADAKNKGQAPVIINNNTTNSGGGKGEQPMMKGSSRSEESALSRYGNRTASFF